MRKLWCLAIVVVLAACAVVFLFPALAYVPLGHVNHEAFFDGKPTSYWTRAVQGEGFLGQAPPKMDVGQALRDGGKESVGVLTQMLQDPDRNVRRQAMLALSYIGTDAKPAASILAEMMIREENSVMFMAASAALAKADPELECETLAVVLRNPSNRDCRACALAVLLDSAAQCQAILPAVQELFQEPDVGLRIDAIRVLGRMRQPPEPLAAALCAILNTDQVENAGVQAIEALGELGAAAKTGVPLLVKILKDPSTRASGRNFGPPHLPGVIIALGRIGPDASSSIPTLESLLVKAKNEELRRHILEALSRIGAPAK
jgi:HEAT repeat protein